MANVIFRTCFISLWGDLLFNLAWLIFAVGFAGVFPDFFLPSVFISPLSSRLLRWLFLRFAVTVVGATGALLPVGEKSRGLVAAVRLLHDGVSLVAEKLFSRRVESELLSPVCQGRGPETKGSQLKPLCQRKHRRYKTKTET